MPYRIAGVDVHKKMLAVVIADVGGEGEYEIERRRVGTNPSELRRLAEWLVTQEVEEVVMESTAHIGARCGRRCKGSGARTPKQQSAGLCREQSTSRRRNRIRAPADASEIFRMPSGW